MMDRSSRRLSYLVTAILALMSEALDLTESSQPTLRALDELIDTELRDQIREGIRAAGEMLSSSQEPFGWQFLDLTHMQLPPGISSGAIFTLPAGGSPQPHRHPNSVQHMRALAGQASLTLRRGDDEAATIEVGGARRWVVIAQDVVHAFDVASTEDFVVLSFHSVSADEIIEVSSAGERRYEAR
jgi:oxalate decarboxylase/phosphoglucose isomerase-like protein (cupin superfamily)